MSTEQIIRQTAEILADKIKIKGFFANMFKRTIIEGALLHAHNFIKSKSNLVADNFVELCEAYNTADKNQLIDQAAELLAAIVKQVFYPEIIIRRPMPPAR